MLLSHSGALPDPTNLTTFAPMTSTDLATTPTRQAIAVQGRSAPGKVTGRLRKAIEAMVWDGARRREAAEAQGLTDHGLRCAFRKPHVKAYYLSELEVLRTNERARNIHRLVEIREHAPNMPAVNAIKALEQIGDEESRTSGAVQQAPGLVIVVASRGTDVEARQFIKDINAKHSLGEGKPIPDGDEHS